MFFNFRLVFFVIIVTGDRNFYGIVKTLFKAKITIL